MGLGMVKEEATQSVKALPLIALISLLPLQMLPSISPLTPPPASLPLQPNYQPDGLPIALLLASTASNTPSKPGSVLLPLLLDASLPVISIKSITLLSATAPSHFCSLSRCHHCLMPTCLSFQLHASFLHSHTLPPALISLPCSKPT